MVTFTISGWVRDARNARGINGIVVKAGGKSTTTRWGIFQIHGVPAGPVKLEIDGASSYISVDVSFELTQNTHWEGVASVKLSPKMAPDQWRAVLSWGRQPSDLDSHVNWGWMKTLWYRRGANWGFGLGVTLEKDDVRSYGPETVFFQGVGNCRSSAINCDLAYKIYDYGRGGVIKSKSQGVVTLYHGDGVAGVFPVSKASPNSISRDKNWWHVFTIDGATNKLKYTSSPASGSFLQAHPMVTHAAPMNGTGYDGLGPFPRQKWKRRSQRDPVLAHQRRLFFQHRRDVRTVNGTKPDTHSLQKKTHSSQGKSEKKHDSRVMSASERKRHDKAVERFASF